MRKRRQNPSFGSMCSTTRSTERISWPMPTRCAERTAERRVWTARRSRRLSCGAGRRGLGSWRRSSGTSAIGPPRYAGCGWRRRTEDNAPWESRRSVTGWCRRRRCWCWSRSSRPTCSRSSTHTEPGAARTTPCARCTGWRGAVTAEVVEADLSGYFDSIPHAQLMRSVARRVSDRHVLALLKQWLVAPVEESDGRGGKEAHHAGERTAKRGIPQGAPISPTVIESVHAPLRVGVEGTGA